MFRRMSPRPPAPARATLTRANQARSDGIRQSDPDDCTLSLYNQSNQELALTALAYWSF